MPTILKLTGVNGKCQRARQEADEVVHFRLERRADLLANNQHVALGGALHQMLADAVHSDFEVVKHEYVLVGFLLVPTFEEVFVIAEKFI